MIDKDRATSLLAQELETDLFLISLAIPQVAINFNEQYQAWLDQMTIEEAQQYLEEGRCKPGSMGSKIEAVISFLKAYPEYQALINDPLNIARALDGETGTRIKV